MKILFQHGGHRDHRGHGEEKEKTPWRSVFYVSSVLRTCASFLVWGCLLAQAAEKHIVLIAGKPSHPPGAHEFRAGSLLLQKCLNQIPGISSVVYSNGWPNVENAFDKADAVLIYADGGAGHPAIQPDRMKIIDGLAKKGVGIGCAHYGVEVPKGDPGDAMHRWIGGYYEHLYSVNPMWSPEYKSFPDHPVTRGVQPFSVLDEWYFNMRWRPDMKGVTPVLVAKPSEKVRKGPYVYPAGPYPHIVEANGRDETMMWIYDRPDGGRSFGFTGGHRHVNWGDPNSAKLSSMRSSGSPKPRCQRTASKATSPKKNLKPTSILRRNESQSSKLQVSTSK